MLDQTLNQDFQQSRKKRDSMANSRWLSVDRRVSTRLSPFASPILLLPDNIFTHGAEPAISIQPEKRLILAVLEAA
jgi:hypothetical protein